MTCLRVKQNFSNECFTDATSEQHDYLFLDFKQNTPENLRVRTKILEINPEYTPVVHLTQT